MLLSNKAMLLVALSACFFAVVIGAFGAHGLMALLVENDRVVTFDTANKYHFYHALGMLFICLCRSNIGDLALNRIAFTLMLVGLIVFSGSLYALSITGLSWLGAITPIGGLFFLAAWGTLIRSVIKAQ